MCTNAVSYCAEVIIDDTILQQKNIIKDFESEQKDWPY